MNPRIRVAIGVLLLLLILFLLYPFKTTIVPVWSLRVVNAARTPVSGINVTEHWQYVLLEDAAHDEAQKTDHDGRVSFPERTIRANLLQTAWAKFNRKKEGDPGFKRVPPATIVVWGSKEYEATVSVYNPDQAPESEILVRSSR